MITFKFSIEDLDETSRPYYHNTELSYPEGCNACVEDMIEHFEDFLRAMGYGVERGEIQFIKEE
jgi:hypothetical protein